MQECSIDGCSRKVYARGWCEMHYQRWRTLGDPGEAAPRFMQGYSAEDRFWAKVDSNGLGGCWEWLGTRSDGYGMFRGANGRMGSAYRFAYELLVGPVPKKKELDHLCRNRGCVNPTHLEAVTGKENKRRGEGVMARQSRQTHCKRGHPLEGPEADLCPDPRLGRRICRKCVNMHRRNRYLRTGK